MNEILNLKVLVQQSMNDLISANSLTLIEVSDIEVLLKSQSYVIDIVADRDGVSLVYFDTEKRPPKGYNLFLYLANKRRSDLTFSATKPQTTSYAEFVETEVNSLAQHIRSAAKDILGGSKEWMKSYSWPIVSSSGSLARLI